MTSLTTTCVIHTGCRQLPKRGSGRLFLSSWWVFSIILAATYSGNLIAFLTVTKDKSPFDTLEEMVKQDEYRYGTIDQSMWTMLFEVSLCGQFYLSVLPLTSPCGPYCLRSVCVGLLHL